MNKNPVRRERKIARSSGWRYIGFIGGYIGNLVIARDWADPDDEATEQGD
jgi:hypothetical protein